MQVHKHVIQSTIQTKFDSWARITDNVIVFDCFLFTLRFAFICHSLCWYERLYGAQQTINARSYGLFWYDVYHVYVLALVNKWINAKQINNKLINNWMNRVRHMTTCLNAFINWNWFGFATTTPTMTHQLLYLPRWAIVRSLVPCTLCSTFLVHWRRRWR